MLIGALSVLGAIGGEKGVKCSDRSILDTRFIRIDVIDCEQ
jgi:hypothetical protein